MKIILWDHRRSGKHKHMGEFETTVNGLLNAKELDANGDIVTFSVNKHEKAVGSCEVMKASIIGGKKKSNGKRGPEEARRPSQAIPAQIVYDALAKNQSRGLGSVQQKNV